jgi:AI-2 transport protein TqsA
MHFDGPPKPVGDRTLRLAALVCAVILTIAALSLAHSVMTPVAFALFVIALVWPLQRRLKRKLPQLVAVLITAVVALVAIGIAGWLIMWAFGRIAQWVITNSARLQGLYMHAADLLEQRGLYAAELIAEQFNMSSIVSVMRGIGGSLQGILTFALVTFMFVILGLLELEPLGRRLGEVGSGTFGAAAIDAAVEIAGRLLTYMLVRFGMSLLTGLGFWALTAVYGLDLSREWGVIAFVLNFVPFIGSFTATILPTLFAAAQYESFSPVIVMFFGLNLVQLVVGSYIERVTGAAVSISPFMVLLAVFFFGRCCGASPAPLSACRS